MEEKGKNYISSVKIANGTTYSIKDAEMRDTFDAFLIDTLVLDGGTSTENIEDVK